MSKILVFGSSYDSLINFRGDLIIELKKSGYEIILITDFPENSKLIQNNYKNHYFLGLKRNKISFINNFLNLIKLFIIFRRTDPDIVLAYNIKPVIFSAFLSYFFRFNYFPMITGLGNTFYPVSILGKLFRIIIIILYRITFSKNIKIIFQNKELKAFFIRNKIISEYNQSIIVNGSGVNLKKYNFNNNFPKNMTFLMVSRILKAKGVIEYIQACNILKAKYKDIVFKLIGPIENTNYSISRYQLDKLNYNNSVQYFGYTDDIKEELDKCSVFVLPSYHEGMPRSVLEALAVGRPVITTNIPGSKETVINNQNGFLIKKKNTNDLVEKMELFIKNPNLLIKMGSESNKIAINKFDVNNINIQILNFLKN